MAGRKPLRLAVIGAGATGMLALIKLREAGFDDVTIFEKAADLGGTWRDNTYPGLTCDVPSHLYRYSFEPNPDWSHRYAPGGEIQAYLRRVAEKYDVERSIRFDSEVVGADFRDGKWHVKTAQGPEGAFDAVITATGVLHHPVYPEIEGRETFAGPAFHTARWDHNVDIAGKRVGIIGTGSTATQIVGAIAEKVGHLSLFQRTAQWIMPQPNPEIPEGRKAEYRAEPAQLDSYYRSLAERFNSTFCAALAGENDEVYQEIVRACEANLEENVRDPVLKEKLRPNYQVGCKRLIVSDRFYEALQRPNVDLVTEKIERIEPDGVRTDDGDLHELDILVFATGFDTHRFFRPMRITGPSGRTLDEAWQEANRAYATVGVPGFPNWFILGGPNSPIGNFSFLMTSELQFGYVLQLIERLAAGDVDAIAPRQSATEAFHSEIRQAMKSTVWASGCVSWYLDKNGDVASWPWNYERFEALMKAPDWHAYELA